MQLYKFAKKLELHGLKDLTFAVILELEWEMEAGYCISVASLVFLPNARYDKAIKDWTLKHIGHFSQKLALSEEWMSLVPHLHHELIHHWLIMVTTNARVLSMVQEKVSDETLAQVLADVPTPARQSGNAAMEAGAKTVTEKEDTSGSDETFVEVPKVLAKMAIGSEEEWVDLEDEDAIVKAASSSLPKSIPPQADNSKALVMLGLPVDQKPVSMIYPPLRDPNAKARELLGINDFSKGLIAGRKQTRFMKAKKGVASFNARIIRGHSI